VLPGLQRVEAGAQQLIKGVGAIPGQVGYDLRARESRPFERHRHGSFIDLLELMLQAGTQTGGHPHILTDLLAGVDYRYSPTSSASFRLNAHLHQMHPRAPQLRDRGLSLAVPQALYLLNHVVEVQLSVSVLARELGGAGTPLQEVGFV
jgi:hypothetical protein